MITPIETPWEPDLWRRELRDALRSSHALLRYVGIEGDSVEVDEFPVFTIEAITTIEIYNGNPTAVRERLCSAAHVQLIPVSTRSQEAPLANRRIITMPSAAAAAAILRFSRVSTIRDIFPTAFEEGASAAFLFSPMATLTRITITNRTCEWARAAC